MVLPDKVVHRSLSVISFVADVRHDESENGAHLCGMRKNTASMRVFAVANLLRPNVRVHLELIADQVLDPLHVVSGKVIPTADELVVDRAIPILTEHAL